MSWKLWFIGFIVYFLVRNGFECWFMVLIFVCYGIEGNLIFNWVVVCCSCLNVRDWRVNIVVKYF